MKKGLKLGLIFALALVTVVTFAACGSSSSSNSDEYIIATDTRH